MKHFLCIAYLISDPRKTIYESYRAYKRMGEERQRCYMMKMIGKLKLARKYIWSKNIPNTNAFDQDIPWPQGLK